MKAKTLAQLLDHAHRTMNDADFDVFVGKTQAFLKSRGLEQVAASAGAYLGRIAEEQAREDTLILETPHELTADMKSELLKFFKAEGAPVEEKVDPELIGGFRGTRHHRRFDATLATQLSKLKRELAKG